MVYREWSGFTLNIIDTPGVVEGGYINDRALESSKCLYWLFILMYIKSVLCHYLQAVCVPMCGYKYVEMANGLVGEH